MILLVDDIEIFADGLDHPECVAVHPDGTVWAGGEAGQIYKISKNGKAVETIANTGGFILGIAFSPDASWLAICDLKNHCVWKMDMKNYLLEKFADGAPSHVIPNEVRNLNQENTPYEKLNIPNYPVFDSKGNLYVSESGAFRHVNGKIFCFKNNGEHIIWHHGPFNFANGLAMSANEKYLYIVCTWLPGVERIEINNDGTAGTREVYCILPKTCPDGLALDAHANLYVSCYAPNYIYKVDTNKQVSLLFDDWEAHTLSNPTNMAFGGDNFDEMFTANLGRWHISKIKMNVKGQPLACHVNAKLKMQN